MKKMLKQSLWALSFVLSLSVTLVADDNSNTNYEVFQSETNSDINMTDANTTIVFEGNYNDFGDLLMTGLDNSIKTGPLAFIVGGFSSGGVTILLSLIDPFIMDLQGDQKLLQIKEVMSADKKEVSYIKTLLIVKKEFSLTEKEYKKVFEGEK